MTSIGGRVISQGGGAAAAAAHVMGADRETAPLSCAVLAADLPVGGHRNSAVEGVHY